MSATKPEVVAGRLDRLGQHPTAQRERRPIVERLEAWRDACLDGETGQQRLGEAVDRLHLQPPRRVERAGEQPAGAADRFGVGSGVDRGEVGLQRIVAGRHPGCQAREDALLHLGRPGLGEGQRQDTLGRRARQKEPQHARGQHLRLARPRRRRHPGVALGQRAVGLDGQQGLKRLHARPCHSRTRAS